jgi:hypothetical protein
LDLPQLPVCLHAAAAAIFACVKRHQGELLASLLHHSLLCAFKARSTSAVPVARGQRHQRAGTMPAHASARKSSLAGAVLPAGKIFCSKKQNSSSRSAAMTNVAKPATLFALFLAFSAWVIGLAGVSSAMCVRCVRWCSVCVCAAGNAKRARRAAPRARCALLPQLARQRACAPRARACGVG